MRKNLYNNFIGIDIGKHELVSHLKNDDKTRTYENNRRGFKKFPREHKDSISKSLVSLEATGGYESACLNFLLDKNIAVQRADARKVKNFIRSFGQHAELAHALAKELGLELVFVPISPPNIHTALNQGKLDIVMSGVFLSLDLIRDLSPSNPYLTVKLALIMKDHERKKFATVAAINQLRAKIAVVRSSPRVASAKKLFDEENLILINSHDDFLNSTEADVMLWSTPEAIRGR